MIRQFSSYSDLREELGKDIVSSSGYRKQLLETLSARVNACVETIFAVGGIVAERFTYDNAGDCAVFICLSNNITMQMTPHYVSSYKTEK